MPQVNPRVLAWARETAGLTREKAAKKIQLGPARGMEPADRITALETGTDKPTRSMLARMAKGYRRPLIALYLEEPPRASQVGTDFRTLTGARSAEQDALVQALVRDVIARQGIVRSQLEDDDAEEARFIGTVTMKDGRPRALEALRQVVGGEPGTDVPRREFDELRNAVESAGAYVLLQGDLGSHHTALETVAFRGFVLADSLAPFVVINSNDARPAWSFTLLHEVVHLLLGHTGIIGADAESETEHFCNDIASEYLLPSTAIEALDVSALENDELATVLGRLANEWKVSRSLIAYRLHRSGKINGPTYRRLIEIFRRQWNERRQQRSTGEGGPNPYVVKRHRIGNALLKLVARGLGEGTLPTTKAALALGVKPTQVGRILGMQASA
ncbi:MAG: XRE family transcriptional regulator [Gemmatimonadetes bacterium]|nr:XRE family transcriptional regulator [Gemmatimonadota bacterium]